MYEINIQATFQDYSWDSDDLDYNIRNIRLIAASKEIAEAVTYNLRQMTKSEALKFLIQYDDTIYLPNDLSLEVSCKPLEIDFK